MTDYCSKDDVKADLAGSASDFSSQWDTAITEACTGVSAEFDREIAAARGIMAPWSFVADTTASQRAFTGYDGWRRFLRIDDCVAVTAVVANGKTQVAGTDYVVYPPNGLPIVGLFLLADTWNPKPNSNLVTAKWGYAVAAPSDVHRAAIREVIRAYLAARAGNDDRLGMTPFGVVVTSKAFTNQTWQMIETYGSAAAAL